MSVLIRGMKMPKSCDECPCYYETEGAWRNECEVLGKEYIADDYRPEWCPLVELPAEHGRLIDADALKDTLDYYIREAGWSDEINEALTWVRDEFIDHEPTVIEAEEGE